MNTLDMAGDIIAAGATVAGLLLVFMGNVAASYENLPNAPPPATKEKFRNRAQIACAGFLLAVVATLGGIFGKAFQSEVLVANGIGFLIASLLVGAAVAIRATRDVG